MDGDGGVWVVRWSEVGVSGLSHFARQHADAWRGCLPAQAAGGRREAVYARWLQADVRLE